MRLKDLLHDIVSIPHDADRDIARIELDSRKIQPQDAFIAIKGTQSDGRQYISNSIAKGAAAVIVDAESTDTAIHHQDSVPIIPIANLKEKLGELAARFYGYPAKKLRMIGVTGTNGKTSSTHFIAQALNEPCGVIGTLGSGLYGDLGEVGLTTPDAVTLQNLLQQFVQKGAKAVAMEVSSHSIDQGRINGIEFEIGVFTNLTQDHLDYHGSMAAYAAVKRRFLAESPVKHIIINADDAYGKTWIDELAKHRSVYAYSMQKPQDLAPEIPLIYTENVQLSLQGIKAKVFTPWGEGELCVPLIGQFNLSNVLAVLTTLCLYGMSFQEALKRLAGLKPVPGRMEALSLNNMPLIVVDYAHTPDALEKVLQALRAHTEGKLICVFGCGGDRDQGKRPKMAKIAEDLAEFVIVTNDNPRHEKPERIVEQILAGFTCPERVIIELDRSKAIQNSIQLAEINDCVLIAGKGAERYQQIGDIKFPFDDVEQVSKWAENR